VLLGIVPEFAAIQTDFFTDRFGTAGCIFPTPGVGDKSGFVLYANIVTAVSNSLKQTPDKRKRALKYATRNDLV
jgi:hypothetical protein